MPRSKLAPSDFANLDAICDPLVSQDGGYFTYVKRSNERVFVVRANLDPKLEPVEFDVPIRFGHPFGGGITQISSECDEIYFVTNTGGISALDFGSGQVRQIYTGPGVSQISFSEKSQRIAASIFGDRAAIFQSNQCDVGRVISERSRVASTFGNLRNSKVGGVILRPDFVIDVTISSNGHFVAWHEWALPNMAWSKSQLCITNILDEANSEPIEIFAGGDYFVAQPHFSDDGERIAFLAESDEYLQLWIGNLKDWSATPIQDGPFEHGGIPWGGGNRTLEFSPDGERVFFTRNEAGFGRLCTFDIKSSKITELGKAHHFALKANQNSLIGLRSGGKTPNVVVKYDLKNSERTELFRTFNDKFYSSVQVEPIVGMAPQSDELIGFVSERHRTQMSEKIGGPDIPFRLYRPYEDDNTDLPTIVSFHGGPTDQSLVTFSVRNIAFMQAGFQVLHFDYRGSSGWGKPFREGLNHGFGVVEIADMLSVLAKLKRLNLVKSRPLIVNGGSSGGYSALRSISLTRGLFAGGIAEYPLIDLVDSAYLTHKLESRYFDSLIGHLPEDIEIYRERSISADDLDNVPLLIMHGDKDPVVNYRQVEKFALQLANLGRSVTFKLFPNEGHGFSGRETIENEYGEYNKFLSQF